MRPTLPLLASMAMTLLFSVGEVLSVASSLAADIPATHRDIIDPAQYEDAELVIRVYVRSAGEGSKYLWAPVVNHATIKCPKPVPKDVTAFMKVAHLSVGQGLPVGFATLYLVRYNPSHPEYGWKLLEREAVKDAPPALGYSHHSASSPR